jgi:hypothetical protein
MKKRILVVLFALALSANLRAQVTIGGLTPPKAGALLDLNSTTTGGLVLSNVDLPDLSVIPGGVVVNIPSTQPTNQELAGMIVYNTYAATGVGVHVWDGEDWIKPCAPPTPGEITFSGAFCSGSTFTARINSVKGATKYVWTLPAGLSGTSNDTIITITAVSADTYSAGSISVQAASSCGAGTRRPSEQAVTVYESPAAPTGATANSRCGAGAVTFGATVPGGITIDWYTADTGGSIVSNGEGVTSFSPSLTATTTYYAQARNTTTGCTSASRLAVTGTVNAIPAAPTGATANSRCGSGELTFSATVPGGITIDWYTADTGGSIVSGGEGMTSFSPSLTTTTTYYAQARNITTGCTSASRLAVTGTVSALPMITTVSPATQCVGTVTLTATVTSGATTEMTYTWNIGGTNYTTTTNSYTTSSLSSSVAYTVKVKNAYNCESNIASGTITIQNCTKWTNCGLSSIWNVTGANMNWSDANTYCQNQGTGWRLPTSTELNCMCNTNAPGGFEAHYWSSSLVNLGDITSGYLQINTDCSILKPSYFNNLGFVKCVK